MRIVLLLIALPLLAGCPAPANGADATVHPDLASAPLADLAVAAADLPAHPADLAAAPGDGGAGCNPPCTAGNICVRDQINGGAFFPVGDGGTCPPGRHPEGNACVNDPKYFCMAIPQGCGARIDCACAGMVCLVQQSCPYQCQSATPTQVNCVCNTP